MIGHLTRDIELKYIPSGAAVAKSSIATNHRYKTQNGEQKDETCFLDFNVFGKSAEILNQYVKKGSKVLLEGRLVLEQWTDQQGQNRSRHTLRVENFKFLDNKNDTNNGGQNNYTNHPMQQQQYQAPQQQQNYNNNAQQDNNMQSGGMVQQPQNIPEINIDEDEIPF
jgi:single-strand DNA-binding protein